MKWSSILVLGTLSFLVNACEKHEASALPPEHATAFGEHAWPHKEGSTHGDSHAPAGEPHAAAPAAPAPAPAPAAAASSEAPKFFPEKK